MVTVAGKSVHPAPLWRRLAALLYDLIFVVLLCWLSAVLITLLQGGAAEIGTLSSSGVLLGALMFNGLYFVASWSRSGQTIGMQAWKLRLVASGGSRLSWRHSLLRLLTGLATALPMGLGWLWILWDSRGRSLADIWAGTEMVRMERRP